MTSNLYDKIYNDMKEAMKAKDQQKVLLLRGLISAVKNATVNAGKEITDDAVLSAVKKNLKEIEQSIDSFYKAGRDSAVEKLNSDKLYLMELLPKQMSEDEVKQIVEAVVKDLGASTKKDMGRVMKEVMARVKGAADGKIADVSTHSPLRAGRKFSACHLYEFIAIVDSACSRDLLTEGLEPTVGTLRRRCLGSAEPHITYGIAIKFLEKGGNFITENGSGPVDLENRLIVEFILECKYKIAGPLVSIRHGAMACLVVIMQAEAFSTAG